MATWAEHEAAAGLRQLREPEYDDAAVLCMMGLRRGSPLFIYADDAQHPRTKWWAASFLEALPAGGGFTFHYHGQPYDPRDGVRLFRDVGRTWQFARDANGQPIIAPLRQAATYRPR